MLGLVVSLAVPQLWCAAVKNHFSGSDVLLGPQSVVAKSLSLILWWRKVDSQFTITDSCSKNRVSEHGGVFWKPEVT